MSETPEATMPQPPVERVFPPWSVGRIVFWIAVGTILSIPIGGLIGVAVAAIGIWLGRGDVLDLVQITKLLLQVLFGPTVFFLIRFLLKRKGYPLGAAWGMFLLDIRQIGLVVLSGTAFMSAADLIARTFHVTLPPPAPGHWNWRFLLAADILTNGFVTAVAEELLFRGLLFRAFRLRFSATDAAIFSSLFFTLTHLHYLQHPFHLSVTFLMGIVTALLLERTSTLNASIAFHFSANTTTIFSYYLTCYSS